MHNRIGHRPRPTRAERGSARSYQSANNSYQRYSALAREAASKGDRVEAENYLQHAEHFLRLMKELSVAVS